MTRARQLSKLGNPNVFSVDASNNVGVNSTSPTEKLNVVGVVSATSFFGDGSNLEGVASAGLGTALSDVDTDANSVIYFTDTTLGIGSTVVVDPPSTTNIAYTQYQEVSLDADVDLVVAEGDDFVPDILGLEEGALSFGIGGGGAGGGGISNVVEDTSPQLGGNLDLNGKRIDGVGQINISGGITVSGVSTADSFIGDGSGLTNVTGTGSGIGVSDTGSPVGTAQTINFGTGLDVTTVSAGLVTVTASVASTADVSTSTLNVVGVATFNDKVRLLDSDAIHFGSNGTTGDFKILHDQLNNHNVIYEDITGAEAILQSNIGGVTNNAFEFRRDTSTLAMMRESEIVLYSGGSSKLATSNSGVSVTGGVVATGIATATGVRISGNAGIITATGHVSSGIVTYHGDSSYAAAGRWVLGADGVNHYTFTGPGLGHSTLNDPTLYLMRGQTYMFENKMGAHPFRIQSTSNGSTGTQWNVGVTNNDVSNGVLIFEVPFVCPNTLYYQCTAHANMGGVINIVT